MSNNHYEDQSVGCFGNILSRLGVTTSPAYVRASSSDEKLPAYEECMSQAFHHMNDKADSEVEAIVKTAINAVSSELRTISLDLHENFEIGMKEYHAHDVLTDYLEKKGFTVTRSTYGMETAFQAEYTRGQGRRVGICSEYDGLPGLGQGCGHNLIAISGVATAIGVKALLDSGKASGKVVLFGTPAEEISVGKIVMVGKGAFQNNVDVCMMLHPGPYEANYGAFIAVHDVQVDFHGKPTHASATPWEGVNALDAMVQVWNSVSMMRQQLMPTDRVHGIITNGGQAPNIIPDRTSALFFVRTTRFSDIGRLMTKLENCFTAAALSTGCEVTWKWRENGVTKDVVQNAAMADRYGAYMEKEGITFLSRADQQKGAGGSTDMGNVSYEVPTIHPIFGIHTTASNHTIGFTAAAKTMDAHNDTIKACRGLALTAADVLMDNSFYKVIQEDFKESIKN
ncbi:hypothetical protein CLU79DRAFT_768324 [Phycomyces nitens]|nr:hypothetical protein CLU79DRAFT_768324 [Phycomyces nitens]